MIWILLGCLPLAPAAACAAVWWLARHVRLVWRPARPASPAAVTAAVTVIRPLPQRVIRGELERP